MKLIAQFFISTLISLLCMPMSYAVEWDGKSPLWVGGTACTEKIRFRVMDKMSTAEKYDVEYRVWFTSEKQAYVLAKSYTSNSADAIAVFPDDFYENRIYEKTGQFIAAPSPCIEEKIYWATYVNGKKISDGLIWSKVNHIEVNGKLISIERK